MNLQAERVVGLDSCLFRVHRRFTACNVSIATDGALHKTLKAFPLLQATTFTFSSVF